MMPDSGPVAGHTVEAKRRDLAFDLRGRSWIELVDIDLFAAGIQTDKDSQHLTLQRLGAKWVSHGTWVPWWYGDPVLERTGITIAGANSRLIDCTIDGAASTAVTVTGSGSEVINCVIGHSCYQGIGACLCLGIHDGPRVSGVLVRNNTLGPTGSQQCLELENQDAARIERNDLFGSGGLAIDNGTILGDGLEDCSIIDNHIHDNRGLTPADGWEGYYSNAAMYLQGHQARLTVRGNHIWRCLLDEVKLWELDATSTGNQVTPNPVGEEPVLNLAQAGAWLLPTQVAGLTLAADPDQPGRLILKGLPPGRRPQPGSRLELAGQSAGGEPRKGGDFWGFVDTPGAASWRPEQAAWLWLDQQRLPINTAH
jgi:hypothetical protein